MAQCILEHFLHLVVGDLPEFQRGDERGAIRGVEHPVEGNLAVIAGVYAQVVVRLLAITIPWFVVSTECDFEFVVAEFQGHVDKLALYRRG